MSDTGLSFSDRFAHWIGWVLGYEDVSQIESWRITFGAEWARTGPAWVLFGCLLLCWLSVMFYRKYQRHGRSRTRMVLAGFRAVLLCLLFVIVADPILEIQLVNHPKPLLWVLFDGTDSMAIEDKLPEAQQNSLAESVALRSEQVQSSSASAGQTSYASRMDYVKAWVNKEDENLFEKLSEKYRLRGYILDRPDGVRTMSLANSREEFDPKVTLAELTTEGQVTALGTALEDLALRHSTGNLAGLMVVSDFNRNAGPLPEEAAKKLNVPLFAVGVGATTAVDLALEHLEAPVKMKKAEESSLTVTLRHQDLANETVHVRLSARKIAEDDNAEPILVGEKDVALSDTKVTVDFPFTPKDTGRFLFFAEVGKPGSGTDERGFSQLEPLAGEVVSQNNSAGREVTIIDDFMRLLFVEYEPTWEWRFVKEVFHRDELVGLRGFRTFLRSSDPIVRENNELFVQSLTLPRAEFFQNDVIFLGDMPADALSTRFCEMTKEFVSEFGGGLVVIAGPRFGPGQLAKTPLADMLPVFVDPDAQARDEREFRLELTPTAMLAQYDFMKLGATEEETLMAWNNLGRLPWYQPVQSVEPSATTVLAEHPTDFCINGKSKQPLIAIRQYGRGEVVYVAFNEMWRLRRLYGEKYYRNFWGPLIKRLGLSHALGQQKRFVTRTDRKEYQADEKVLLTVEAYDEDFNPLTEELVEKRTQQKSLEYELRLPGPGGATGTTKQQARVSLLRPGVFETRIPVFQAGEYSIRVNDPITGKPSDPIHFQVTSLSAERRSAVRDVAVQNRLADITGGKAYDLTNVNDLLKDFSPAAITERTVDIRPLWSTWPCFALLIVLMLGEWWGRKIVNLP